MGKAAPSMKLLDRIKKLLSLAGNNPNATEAASATAKAHTLMREHNIAMSQVIMDELRADKHAHMGRRKAYAYVNKPTPGYKGHHRHVQPFAQWMAVAVGDLFDCHSAISVIEYNDGQATFACVEFYGYKTDVEVAQWTFSYLMECVRRAGLEYRRTVLVSRGLKGADQKRHSTSFREGFSTQICERIGELIYNRNRERAGNGRELVLYENKREAIEAVFGKFQYGESDLGLRSLEAWEAGQAEARKVPLNTPIEEAEKSLLGAGANT